MPAVPLLVLLAAAELCVLLAHLRARSWKTLGLHACVVVGVLSCSLAIGIARQRAENQGFWWSSLGNQHVQAGEFSEGERLMRYGLTLDPKTASSWRTSVA